MLSAAEASMDAAAEDDAERQRNRARLYAPPKGYRPAGARPGSKPRRPAAARMTREQAQALAAQLGAEDARLGKRGNR